MQPIDHISDTSFWIAAYRAEESLRADAAFTDPFAAKLADEKGMQLMREMPRRKVMAFAITMRTTSIDHLIQLCIEEGVDTVINLGAGLDTRPYRMRLPADLKWIEVDFESVIKFKSSMMEPDQPVCRLTRVVADLSERQERRRRFAQWGKESRKAVVLTEGLIGYLTNDQAAALSEDIHEVPAFCYWIHNYRRGRMRNTGTRRLAGKMNNASPLTFTAKDPFSFFARQGWKVMDNIGLMEEGAKFGRKLPAMFPWNILLAISPAIRRIANRSYGCVLFKK